MRGAIILFLIALLAITVENKIAGITASKTNAVAGLLSEEIRHADFAYALEPVEFTFPKDHGAHPQYRSEWWYFTGNTRSTDHRIFGFQLTIFRFALKPSRDETRSPWRTSNVYLGHFAVSDIHANEFHSFERPARAALDVAGTSTTPRIWIKDWAIERERTQDERWRLSAREADVALELKLIAKGPVIPQGDAGLSQKSTEAGNASYYYSIPRFDVAGTITTPSGEHRVDGSGWFDHEWGTSALSRGQVGWDWFSLHLDDDSELMFYQIREASGGASAGSHGILTAASSAPVVLTGGEVKLSVLKHWHSPLSGARYPARWRLQIPKHDIDLVISPRMSDQEWRENFTYWEGAVSATGKKGGRQVSAAGYVELVGYD